jgi:hypothetical protein
MATQFMSDLDEGDLPIDLRQAITIFLEGEDFKGAVLYTREDGTIAQQYPVRILAFDRTPRRLVGTVTLEISLRLAPNGTHVLLINLNDAALIDDDNEGALAAITNGAAAACDHYVLRYALSTIGNKDSEALIRLEVHAENMRNGDIAAGLVRKLKQHLRGRVSAGGYVHGKNEVRFEVVDVGLGHSCDDAYYGGGTSLEAA